MKVTYQMQGNCFHCFRRAGNPHRDAYSEVVAYRTRTQNAPRRRGVPFKREGKRYSLILLSLSHGLDPTVNNSCRGRHPYLKRARLAKRAKHANIIWGAVWRMVE